jgi:hypothetical protein
MVHPDAKLQMKLIESEFSFSKRMLNMITYLELVTLGDLTAIPLKNLKNFRGFKTQCKRELIAFIEFESIESLFEGYREWKKA